MQIKGMQVCVQTTVQLAFAIRAAAEGWAGSWHTQEWKAALRQRPSSMTVEDHKPALTVAVAAPILKLCVLKWAGLRPSDSRYSSKLLCS